MMLSKERCKSCGKRVRPVILEKNLAYCPNCGYKHFLSEDEMRRSQKNMQLCDISSSGVTEKMKLIAAAIVIFLIVVCMMIAIHSLSGGIKERSAEKRGEVPIGSCEQFMNIPCEAAVEHLETLGMSNIKVIELDEKFIWPNKRGKVQFISIGGETNFGKNFYAKNDDLVIIRFYKAL